VFIQYFWAISPISPMQCFYRLACTAYVQNLTHSHNIRQKLTRESSHVYASSQNLSESLVYVHMRAKTGVICLSGVACLYFSRKTLNSY